MTRQRSVGLFTVCLAAQWVSFAAAQTYELTWYTVDGGGTTASTGGSYELGGTIGQPDASGALVGGSCSLVGPTRVLRGRGGVARRGRFR